MIELSILNNKEEIQLGKNDYQDILLPLYSKKENYCYLATQDFHFSEGDIIRIETNHLEAYLVVKLDETLDSTILYVPNGRFDYIVRMDEKSQDARSDIAFQGKRHYLSVRFATDKEIASYRNWALNPHDNKEFSGGYPHASANVETREDATFFACNAIDGIYASNSHGEYPYQSWGINRQKDAQLTIFFGRLVEIDQVSFTLRADFPHDSYWRSVALYFSDGSNEEFSLRKSGEPQFFPVVKRVTSKITFKELYKAEDDSPFPALTEIELYGYNG